MASIALGASVAARVTPAGLKPGRRGALTRRGDVSSARKSIRCDAADDEVRPAAQKRAPEASRRGFLGTAAAFAAGALPWSRDLAALAAGDPFPYPDVISMQEAFWAKATKAAHPERWYPYWWALPLAPYGSKATAMATVVPGEVWTFDQLQGLLDVLVNVRMTVVKLENAGLWVHNPVAPTGELMRMLEPLVDEHGPVKHIVVGSAAIEHKIYSGPFSKKFPSADVWLPPKNWSFPVDVPLERYVPYYPLGSPKTLPEDTASGVGKEDRHRRRGRWAALPPALFWLPVARALVQRGQAPWSDLPAARAAGAATAVGRRAAQARDTGRWHRRRTRCTAGHPWAACRRDRREPLRRTASYRRTRVSAGSSEPSSRATLTVAGDDEGRGLQQLKPTGEPNGRNGVLHRRPKILRTPSRSRGGKGETRCQPNLPTKIQTKYEVPSASPFLSICYSPDNILWP